jgi:hypothetical protein
VFVEEFGDNTCCDDYRTRTHRREIFLQIVPTEVYYGYCDNTLRHDNQGFIPEGKPTREC